MQRAVTSHPELKLMGKPTFCFSFSSDAFNVYHVNDFMKDPRLALQRAAEAGRDPHVRDGTADPGRDWPTRSREDLADAVAYAKHPPTASPQSGGVYGGGGEWT